MIVWHLSELLATDILVLIGADLGHADPQWIRPHHVPAGPDPVGRRFRLLAPAVSWPRAAIPLRSPRGDAVVVVESAFW